MRIIVDGNDGVGKTTLAKKLQKDLNIKSYIHLSGSDPKDFNFYYRLLDKQDVIFDRSFMDEPIYSIVLDRKCELTLVEEALLYNYVESNKIIVVICFRKNKLYDPSEDKRIIRAEKVIDDYFLNVAENNNYIIFDCNELLDNSEKYNDLLQWLTYKKLLDNIAERSA